MTSIAKDAQTLGLGFIPEASMQRYAGGFKRRRAQHKATPEDFIVEEKQPGYQCTVSTHSDFANPDALECDGRYIAFTLVTYRMTTSAGCKAVARMLNVDPSLITVAGNKDRTARTAQAAVVEISDLDLVRRNSFPDEEVLKREGFFIKDVRRCNSSLGKGRLEGNRFHIKLISPGLNKQALAEYMRPRIEHILAVHGDGKRPFIPNFYWRQRLGRRQNLLGVGVNLVTEGLESGIRRFMCEVVEQNDHPLATKLRRQIAPLWENATAKAESVGGSVAEQHCDFIDMVKLMEQQTHYNRKASYQPANMFIEHTLAYELAKCRDFEELIRRNRAVRDDVSLWVGAYQGYWFNQVLGRVLDGDIPTSALEPGDKEGEFNIPLYFPGDESSVAFYKRVCPEAIPDHLDPVVRRLFLLNPKGRRGPRRPAFITVNDLEYTVHDEMISFKFLLRSGAYATNFLSLLFDLDSDSLGGA
jgi:tRNA(Glu) U13 pseudouridine synthase TruD